jgi:hypothetical protein
MIGLKTKIPFNISMVVEAPVDGPAMSATGGNTKVGKWHEQEIPQHRWTRMNRDI